MASLPTRVYYPIWDAIKKNYTAKLSADPAMHRRIIKAVIKEKDKDISFKQTSRRLGLKHKLDYSISDDVITFTLTKSYLSLGELL